jgi:hypothetical protein
MATGSTIELPRAYSVRDIISGIEQIRNTKIETDRIHIDFSKFKFVTPFGMLLISSEIHNVIKKFQIKGIVLQNIDENVKSYLSHMGFFKSSGIDFGKNVDVMRSTENYFSITRYATAQIEQESAGRGQELAETIETLSRKISETLLQTNSGDTYKSLSFSIREIIRNVFEHSQSDDFWAVAQRWPNKDKIQVAILDKGVGLKAALSRNSKLDIKNDRDAIQYALLPGVSGTPNRLHPSNISDDWRNSGFGLFMASHFCRECGGFAIFSGKNGLIFDPEKTTLEIPDIAGVAIRLDIRESDLKYADARRKKILDLGHQMQKELNQYDIIPASRASTMLTAEGIFEQNVAQRATKLKKR